VSPDGSRVFITGVSETTNTTSGMLTAAYDATTGDELWAVRTDPSPGDQDIALTLAVSPAGDRLYVAGSRGPFIPSDLAILAYDAASGSELWEVQYNGPGNYDDGAALARLSPDGGTLYVTGTSFGQDTYQDYVTLAYDAGTGGLKWESRYDGPAGTYESANGLGLSPDGGTLYVTGSSEQWLFGPDDYATVAYDALTGSELWVTRFDAPVDSEDEANELAVSPGGRRLYVTGESRFDYTTLAYRAETGDLIWKERYGGPDEAFDSAYYVVVSPDGRAVYVTGTVQGDVVTLAYRG
jgi:outer membrane protein assembly factor BamB